MAFRRSVQGGLGWTRSAVPVYGPEFRIARPAVQSSIFCSRKNVDLQPSRSYSAVPQASGRQRTQAGRISIKAGVLFAGLSAFAVVLTTYGVWDYFAAFRVWPKELREPLRAALKAKNHGKFGRSAAKFREALEIARKMDSGKLGNDYLLKVTGIAIALGDALELDHKPEEAAMVYLDALNQVTQRGVYAEEATILRSPEERMRGVSLAQKLGDLAVQGVDLPLWDDGTEHKTQSPAEGYLSWSVSELIRLMQANAPSHSDSVMLSDLHLPAWVTTQEIGGSVEALGAFYASHDIAEYAVPLYLQAISLLMPVKGAPTESRPKPTAAERCRAAVLMNNISQVLAQGKRPAIPSDAIKPSTEPLDQAMAWAAKGLDLATLTSYRSGFLSELPEEEQKWLLQFSGFDPSKVGQVATTVEAQSQERLQQVRNQCLGTQFVLLYNLGMYNEMKGDVDAAKTLFSRAMRQADLLGLREARAQCARSLRRIHRT
ncbi:hypothetical protein MYAM1_003399 [Malassezia yamatoensis]|uniref:Uncharacterized protein n=1 Tax=Malassezia yamatoensis TaxID=253288 RepID=A0AAJ6CHT4_9BASI|nr:hypothetical protein MYAM1_003399 [Malassezia yamatoensis]